MNKKTFPFFMLMFCFLSLSMHNYQETPNKKPKRDVANFTDRLFPDKYGTKSVASVFSESRWRNWLTDVALETGKFEKIVAQVEQGKKDAADLKKTNAELKIANAAIDRLSETSHHLFNDLLEVRSELRESDKKLKEFELKEEELITQQRALAQLKIRLNSLQKKLESKDQLMAKQSIELKEAKSIIAGLKQQLCSENKAEKALNTNEIETKRKLASLQKTLDQLNEEQTEKDKKIARLEKRIEKVKKKKDEDEDNDEDEDDNEDIDTEIKFARYVFDKKMELQIAQLEAQNDIIDSSYFSDLYGSLGTSAMDRLFNADQLLNMGQAYSPIWGNRSIASNDLSAQLLRLNQNLESLGDISDITGNINDISYLGNRRLDRLAFQSVPNGDITWNYIPRDLYGIEGATVQSMYSLSPSSLNRSSILR